MFRKQSLDDISVTISKTLLSLLHSPPPYYSMKHGFVSIEGNENSPPFSSICLSLVNSFFAWALFWEMGGVI